MKNYLNTIADDNTSVYEVEQISPLPQITVLLYIGYWTLGYLCEKDHRYYQIDASETRVEPTKWALLPNN